MTYFVRIDRPKKLRRDILQSAKESILYQYEYEEFLELRQEKRELLQQIDKEYDELEETVDSLLSQIDIEEVHEDIDVDEAIDEEPTPPEEKHDEVLTDTDRLKYTLDRIESTLEDL